MTAAILGSILIAAIVTLPVVALIRRDERWTITDRGNEIAASLAGRTTVEVYDARERVYVRATRHPSGDVILEYRDPETRAEELARDLLGGEVA